MILGMSLTSRYIGTRDGDPLLATILMLGIGGCATFVIASPVAIGFAMRLDLDKSGRAREEERSRFAAHLHPGQLVVDLVYRPSRTLFLELALASGATIRNGLGMLVHQAAGRFPRSC